MGGSRFQKELSIKTFLDIEGTITPPNPSNKYLRLFFNTTGNTLQTLDSSGKLNILNPLTSKGDLLTHDGTTENRLPVGTDTYILTSDSTESTGLKWIVNTGGGETNTASNVGTAGVGVFKQKSGLDFQFKNINAASTIVSVSDDTGTNEIDIGINEGNIIHQNLSGAGTNTHTQIDSHISSTLNPHSVTIDQITVTTTKGDILVEDGSNVVRLPVGTDTYILTSDSTESTGLKWIVNTGGGGGEANTASNVGTAGVGVFKQKSGLDFQFKNINAASTIVSVSDDTGTNEIDIGINEGNIVHQNLSGAGTNTHAQIDSHISSTGNPHSVTIDQITVTTTKGDILVEDGSNVIRLPIGTDGQVLLADSSEASGLVWGTESSNATASNVGAGIGVFKQKTGNDLEFKSITSTTDRISVVSDTLEVDLTLNEGNIVHQNLSGAGTNTHAQIDSHISSTGNPHSVTIDQITVTTTKGDILVEDGSNVIRLPIGTDGQVLLADSSEASGLVWGTESSNATASNVGAGIGVFKQKTGNDLEFKSITSTTDRISVVSDTLEVDLTLNEGNIVHQNLSGAGTNTHAQIDSHISSTGNPHSVTIDQITVTTTKGDILVEDGSNVIRLPIGTDGQVLLADSSEASGLVWGTESSNATASNVGAGIGVFKQKTGNDLEFKSITSTTDRISVVSDTLEVDLTLNEGNIVHQNLSGAGTNTHAQIDSHISSTGNPHSVTIDQITVTTTKGDILVEDGSNVIRLPIGTDGQVLLADSSEASGLVWGTESSNATASNVGAGIGVFKQKTGNDLEFKSITSTTDRISVVSDTLEVDLTLNEGNIVHQNLSGAGTNTHAQIDSHISSTGNPHSVTIDQVTVTTTKGDILVEDGSNVIRLPIGTDGQVLRANSVISSGIEWDDFDHGSLLGLGDDDHTQYLLLGGRAGGQIALGGTGASDNLILTSTSNITKGQIIVTETTNSTSITTGALQINGGMAVQKNVFIGDSLDILNVMTLNKTSTPSNSTSTSQHFYLDTTDNLFKSINNSGIITTYQPTNTKGDVLSHNGATQEKLSVGSESQVLTVDASQPTGIKWANVSSGTGGTGSDPNSNKYCNLYSSGSQTFSDSYQDLLFDSDRRIDDIYTHSLLEQNIIEFNLPGKFLISFRMTSFVETGNNNSTSSVRLVSDTGGGYTEIPGTQAFMFNRDDDNGCNTSSIIFIYQAASNEKIKIQFKRDSGSSTIKSLQNGSELLIIKPSIDTNNDNSQFFSSYVSSSQNISTSYTDVLFNTTRLVDSIYTYNTSTGILDITEDGIYIINCNISTRTNSNTETQSNIRLVIDSGSGYTEIPGTRSYIHNDDSPDSDETAIFNCVYSALTGDKVKIQAITESGANLSSTIVNGCNFNVLKLSSTLGQSSVKYFDGYNDTGNTTLNTNYIDIPIKTERLKDTEYTHTPNSSQITLEEDGRYIIFAKVSIEKSSGTTRSNAKTRLVANNGQGFFEVAGTESCSYHTNTNTGTEQSFINGSFQFSAGTIIKLQSVILDGNNLRVAPLGTSISILRLEPLTVGEQGLVIFGTELNYVESTSTTSTNSTNYVQKIRLVTDNIPSGIYRVGFYYIWTIDNTNQDFSSRIQIDDSLVIHETTESTQRSNQDIATSGFSHISLTLGVHTIDLDFKVASTNTSASIKEARIEIWRLT
ncbi:hypothetical protein SAGO17_0005 [Mimivirus AB-566-O17]|uniref:Uncharacterized protein n=1 Tax=Mimivirus AB-566-O17 TaxID=1988039 RepID=A0A1X9VNK7_9VIRU|nr:hypothetical protein SAGO17_0005 [Mimivirus AB-566-O17]